MNDYLVGAEDSDKVGVLKLKFLDRIEERDNATDDRDSEHCIMQISTGKTGTFRDFLRLSEGRCEKENLSWWGRIYNSVKSLWRN